MTLWSDHPYHNKGHLYLYKPSTVFAAQLDYTNTYTYGKYSSTNIWYLLYYDTVSAGAIGNVVEGMTLLLGSSAGADDLGRCRVKGTLTEGFTGGSETVIVVWASANIHDGEIFPQSTAYITVLDDFRPWWKPPSAIGGTYAYDGPTFTGAGATYNQYPVANLGPDYLGYVNTSTGVAEIDFDGSGSYATSQAEVIGAYSDISDTYSVISASSENGGNVVENAVDDDGGTYWEATGATSEYIDITFPSAVLVAKFSITADSTTTAPNTGSFSAYHAGIVSDSYQVMYSFSSESGWSAGEQRTWTVDREYGPVTKFRLYINSANGAATIRIREIEIISEDRTSGTPYTWDEVDGAYKSGSTNASESPTIYYGPGHRHIGLTVQDTNGATYARKGRRHVVTLVPDDDDHELDYSGGTPDAGSELAGNGVEYLFDNDNESAWVTDTGVTATWVEMDFGATVCVTKYGVRANNGFATANPNTWTFQSWNGASFDDVDSVSGETSWGNKELRVFTLDEAAVSTKFRLNITANNGHATYLGFNELNLLVHNLGISEIRNFEITEHRLTRKGQEMRVRVYEDIALSDYPAGTWAGYWEDEVIGGVAGSLSDAGPTDREHVKMTGWLLEEPTRIEATEAGTRSYVELVIGDIGAWLDRMPMKPLIIEREDSSTPAYAYQMTGANIDRKMLLLLQHFTTVLEITDFFWKYDLDFWAFSVLSCSGGTMWTVLNDRAQACVCLLSCDKFGRLWVRYDQQLLNASRRSSTVQLDLTEDDWSVIDYTYQRRPRYHWSWANAVEVSTDDADVVGTISTFFSVAPGQAPGQGAGENNQGEQLAQGQGEFNIREGHRYAARLNAPYSYFRVDLTHAADSGADPAILDEWVTLDISADTAAQRGLTLTDEKFLLHEMYITHNHEARTKDVSLVLEQYIVGEDAETHTPA